MKLTDKRRKRQKQLKIPCFQKILHRTLKNISAYGMNVIVVARRVENDETIARNGCEKEDLKI